MLEANDVREDAISSRRKIRRAGYVPADGGKHAWVLGADWIGPGAVSKAQILADNQAPGAVGPQLTSAGDLQAWAAQYKALTEENDAAAVVIAAAFAAPLLRHLGWRSLLLHLHGDSRVGKSALLNFALSAWGPPGELLRSVQSTSHDPWPGASDIAVGVDDVAPMTKLAVRNFVEDSVRGLTADPRPADLWGERGRRLFVLSAGEFTSRTPASMAGRVVNLRIDTPLANPSAVYACTRLNYGLAGRALLARAACSLNDPEKVSANQRIMSDVTAAMPKEVDPPVYQALQALGQGAVVADVVLLGIDPDAAASRCSAILRRLIERGQLT